MLDSYEFLELLEALEPWEIERLMEKPEHDYLWLEYLRLKRDPTVKSDWVRSSRQLKLALMLHKRTKKKRSLWDLLCGR